MDYEKPVMKKVLKMGLEVLSFWKILWLGDLKRMDYSFLMALLFSSFFSHSPMFLLELKTLYFLLSTFFSSFISFLSFYP